MHFEKQLASDVYQVDRPLHHELALDSYRESFRHRNLTKKYEETEFRRLGDVFKMVSIADPNFPTISRPVDTFDLINPYQASRVVEACYRDLPSRARVDSCLKAIDRYCDFLKSCPLVHLPGQAPLYLPSVYGPIESPVNRYTIPRSNADKKPNRNYLEAAEYKVWLRFTWSRIRIELPVNAFRQAVQLHTMCVIAGETGMRLQEILGLQPEHINLEDGMCLVVKGKGSKGSGYRKRAVPLSELAKKTLRDYFSLFPRAKEEPLFQGREGHPLSKNTAHHWMDSLIDEIQTASLPIFIDKGFGWHAFRRTYTRLYLERGGNIFELKRNTGWAYTSTISNYLGDSKQKALPSSPPLYFRKEGNHHGN
jgi:integrase